MLIFHSTYRRADRLRLRIGASARVTTPVRGCPDAARRKAALARAAPVRSRVLRWGSQLTWQYLQSKLRRVERGLHLDASASGSPCVPAVFSRCLQASIRRFPNYL